VKSYRVSWTIDIDAGTPEEAAREAVATHRDPDSIASVFDVTGEDGKTVEVDLDRGTQQVKQRPYRVWFDFGNDDPQLYEFASPEEMMGFIDGIDTAAEAFGIDDYRRFDTQEEVEAFLRELRGEEE
jgi:hypothetical protein